MVNAAERGRDLMGGTKAMRDAGKKHLPKFNAESEEAYDARLKSSWLFNGYRKTVTDMTGRVFDIPVELGETAPDSIVEWCKNVDLEGRDLSTFARQVFEDALSGSAIGFIMVDAPKRDGEVTRQQASEENLRPFFVHLKLEEVLGWKTAVVGNATKLVQFRIMECVKEPDPNDEFTENEIDQVRVLDLVEGRVQTRLYRKGRDEKWALHDGPYFTDADEITVAAVYLNRTGFFTCKPLLDDLADVNIAHWQSQSDQRNILHYARVPILFAAGRSEDEGALEISASAAVTASDPQAKLEWVEHSGQAIGAGRQDLKDLEFQMETHGLQLLVQRGGAQSATGEALDAQKETSTLSMTADQLQDALEQCLLWMAEYGNIPDADITVKVNKEFGVGMMTAQEMTVMLSAVNTGNMSRRTFLGEMARRGMVRPDLDIDEEEELIEADQDNIMTDGVNGGEQPNS